MHPEALAVYAAAKRRGLKDSDWPMRVLCGRQFVVSEEMNRLAFETIQSQVRDGKDSNSLETPRTSQLPAQALTLVVSGAGGARTSVWLCWEKDGDVGIASGAKQMIVRAGGYRPGQTGIFMPREPCVWDEKSGLAILRIAFIVSLINHPRFTCAREVKPKGRQRRRVERVLGRPAKGWTEVGWSIGKPVMPRGGEISEEGHPKALHWCRGHYRRARSSQPRAVWLEPPEVLEAGWYVWVRDCWKGDPAYGLRLQRHAPRLPGEKREPPGAASPSKALDRARFEALGEAERRALVEAGFAPSFKLH